VQVEPDIQPDVDAVGEGAPGDPQPDPRQMTEVDHRGRPLAVDVLHDAVGGDDEQGIGIC
jgi:hypothetical protein